VRKQVIALMAISPEGRTMAELRAFLVTQRPASRDTVARVLAELVGEGLLHVAHEPAWRRRVRASIADRSVRQRPARRGGLRGRSHQLFTPTRALHALVLSSSLIPFPLSEAS
jgi:hypothetical protein